MTLDSWIIYVSTILVFMSTPGPSHLLMLSNSLGNGFKRSTATAAGDLSANFLQMIVASAGLASLLQSSQDLFVWVKWAGVAYLVYLGLKLILSPVRDGAADRAQRSIRSLYWQGFITSAANPKAVIFFAALFPQFITPGEALLPQFAVLSASYLLIDGAFLCCYGKFAELISRKLHSAVGQHMNQVSGALFILAAVLLGAKGLERS